MEKCKYSFEELSSKRFPALLQSFEEKFSDAYSVSELFREGNGYKSVLKETQTTEDFPGIYVFLSKDSLPVYFGISQKVIQRLCQHTKRKDHFAASLAYNIHCDSLAESPKSRSNVKLDKGLEYLKDFKVTYLEISCPIEKYLFEVYCCMKYQKSCKWNVFETH